MDVYRLFGAHAAVDRTRKLASPALRLPPPWIVGLEVQHAPERVASSIGCANDEEDFGPHPVEAQPELPVLDCGVSSSAFTLSSLEVHSGSALPEDVAIVGLDSAKGRWWYSVNAGETWSSIPAVSDAKALLLSKLESTRLFFQPDAGWIGTAFLTVRVWDKAAGSGGEFFNVAAAGSTHS